MPAISVVIPAYNSEDTISETIESVLEQTFSNFELIIVNDGSTDKTLEIISRFLDERIKVISQENSGPQRSRNVGAKNAQGKYIAFLDADDLWTANKLELQFKALENNLKASVVYSWTNVIDQNGQFSRRGGRCKRKGNVFFDLLLSNFLESGSNPLIRLDAIENIGGFDERIVAAQDWDLYIKLAEKYSFECIPEVQVLYRKRLDSKSWSKNIKRQEEGLLQILRKHISSNKELEKYRKYFMLNSYKYLLFECLQPPFLKTKALQSIRLFWMICVNEFSFATKKISIKIFLRILALLLLPRSGSTFLFKEYLYFFDVTSLMGDLKLNNDF